MFWEKEIIFISPFLFDPIFAEREAISAERQSQKI
jgi:hypothetical protein